MLERAFDVPFVAAMALREKQIQQNYRPIIAVHKWFARRPGTLFRALLLAEFAEEDLRQAFFKAHDFAGKRVADPFMGGGTPLLEANRLGCDVIGYDINPMAYWIVRQEIESLDLEAYAEAAALLRQELEERVGPFYRTRCLECGSDQAQGRQTRLLRSFRVPGLQQILEWSHSLLLALEGYLGTIDSPRE